MTHFRGLVLIAVVLALVSVSVSLAVGQEGRNHSVATQRAGCYRASRRNAVTVNVWRAQATASHAVATDPKQPLRTRRARAREVRAIVVGIRIVEGQTDLSATGLLADRVDRANVRANQFSCVKAYPSAGFLS